MILCLTTPGDTGYNGDPLNIESDLSPITFKIGSPYPNPFNGKVSIPIRLSNKSLVNFNVYDLSGSVVYNSNLNYQSFSENSIFWDGKNNNGSLVSSGTYNLKVINGLSTDTKKIIEHCKRYIPKDSTIFKLISDIQDWSSGNLDWEQAREKIDDIYGYEKFIGGVHIVPNHALIILALLFGDDNFQKSLMTVSYTHLTLPTKA